MSYLSRVKQANTMSEEMILQGCLDNLSTAQEALYNRFSPRMLGVCYRYARNKEDAVDMLQEGFMKVYSQIHQYR
jgi:RNA polymerase sigma-70 factor (ECF subfamily)